MTPHRICILGNSGSGKSTLAHLLGQRYSLPVYHLDRELLTGQFISRPEEEQRRRHRQIIAQDGWIIDGRYSKLLPERLARADLVIFLNVPRWVVIPRTAKRAAQTKHRIGAPQGARSSYTLELLRHQLRYNRRHRLRRLQADIASVSTKITVLVLERDSLEGWLRTIEDFFTGE